MTINIYKLASNRNDYKPELIAENLKVRSVYSEYYFRKVPTLSAKRCAKIYNSLYGHFKADGELFLFENVKTGYKGIQALYRHGTVLNF